MIRYLLLIALLLGSTITGCSTTPISGKKALILIPFSQETTLGAQAFQEVLKKETVSQNATSSAVVERVGRRLAAVTNMPQLDWEFKLIESKDLNAFALPGGKTAIYSSMLPICANEAGLAAVMGHEIAHVIARHSAQRMSQDMLLKTGMTAASISLANSSQQGMIMGALGLGASLGVTLPFSRGMEAEADEIGLIYMAKAGYDPAEAEKFWIRFANSKQGKQQPEFLSTHPADSTRISKIRRLLPKAQAIYQRNPNKYGLGISFVASSKGIETPPAVTQTARPDIKTLKNLSGNSETSIPATRSHLLNNNDSRPDTISARSLKPLRVIKKHSAKTTAPVSKHTAKTSSAPAMHLDHTH